MNWIKNKFSLYYNILEGKKVYQFAITFILISLCFSYFIEFPYRWILIVLIVLQAIGLKAVKLLKVEYALLSLVTYPIGLVVSTIALFTIYSLVIFPIGLFKKKKYTSQWIESIKTLDKSKMYE